MNRAEFQKVRVMLGTYFPAAAAKKSNTYWHGLFEAVRPYRYEDVKERLLAYVRENKFFPDISDITMGLSVPEQAPACGDHSWMRPYCEALKAERERKIMGQW